MAQKPQSKTFPKMGTFDNAGNVNSIPSQPAVRAAEMLTPLSAGPAQGVCRLSIRLAQAIAPRQGYVPMLTIGWQDDHCGQRQG